MASSSNRINESIGVLGRRDPGFAVIVAFDYYDGPESGLALYPSGQGIRFSTLGDSRFRVFRAFELAIINGDWLQKVRALPEIEALKPPRRVFVPAGASETLTCLERDVIAAAATGYYVAVGSLNLDWLSSCSVTEEELNALRKLAGTPAGFHTVHQLIKGRGITPSPVAV